MDEKNKPDWLKENLTKEEAQKFLKDPEKPLYSFIVTATKFLPWLTLSIKLQDAIKQYKIYKDSEDFYYFFETNKFDDLEDLINKYSENNWIEIIKEKGNERKSQQVKESIITKTESKSKEVKNKSDAPPIPEKGPNIIRLQKPLKNKIILKSQQSDKQDVYDEPNDELVHHSEYSSTNLLENVKKMSRSDAEKYLSNKEIYSYLIRTSAQSGNKCLSLKTEKVVQHYPIYSHEEKFYIRFGEYFSSINDLIEMYSKNKWDDLINPKCDLYETNNDEYDYARHYQSTEDCDKNFIKTFTRNEAERYLSKLSVFSYLVRPSRNNGELSLSVKLKDRVCHFLIRRKNNYYYIYDYSLFPTLSALTKTYAENDFQDLFNQKPKGEEVTEDIHFARVCKENTKKELMTKPHYSYVLRDSSSFSGCKCLSVKFPDDILHYIIFSSEKGFYIYKYDRFGTIDELIERYSKNQWRKLLEMNRLDKKGTIQKVVFCCNSKLKSAKEGVVKMYARFRYG